jgi:hypothetical protein
VDELRRDVARPGEADAREHGSAPIGAEPPRETVSAVRRNQQQHDEHQIQRDRGRQLREQREPEGIHRRSGERIARADVTRPQRQLARTNRTGDHQASGELGVEEIGREHAVRDENDGEGEERPVRRQHRRREEETRRHFGATDLLHCAALAHKSINSAKSGIHLLNPQHVDRIDAGRMTSG